MAKLYTVTRVEHNAKGPGKNGKYDGSILSTVSEGGNKRNDFVSKSREAGDQGSVVAGLAVGDKVELKIEKSGDFFNLSRDKDAIKLVEKGDGKISTIPSSGGGGGAKPAFGSYKEDPEKQAAIIRQNALTNATNLVTTMLTNGLFKKTVTADVLVCEITRIAGELAGYTSGTGTITKLTAGTGSAPSKDVDGDADPSNSEFGE